MRLLGSFLIGHIEQRQLFDGRAWDIPRDRIVSRKLAGAAIGDLFWLKEPWALASSRRFGSQNIREAIVGPVGTPAPAHLKHKTYRLQPMSALCLERGDSRTTLEVMGISEHAVRVLVHFQQVDAFLKAKAVA